MAHHIFQASMRPVRLKSNSGGAPLGHCERIQAPLDLFKLVMDEMEGGQIHQENPRYHRSACTEDGPIGLGVHRKPMGQSAVVDHGSLEGGVEQAHPYVGKVFSSELDRGHGSEVDSVPDDMQDEGPMFSLLLGPQL